MISTVSIVIEDVLSEAVLKQILAQYTENIPIIPFGFRGCGYIDQKAEQFYRSAQPHLPYIVLRDLDSYDCPPLIINQLIPDRIKSCFLFRIAVREIETWLLADRQNAADFLGVRINSIPEDVETIRQPKEFLVSLARRSRKRGIRENIPPEPQSTAKVGRGYNTSLIDFTYNNWDINEASNHAESLRRAIEALKQFFPA